MTTTTPDTLEDLMELQLRIARRADQLSRMAGYGRDVDRRVWLRAELEILEQAERAGGRWWWREIEVGPEDDACDSRDAESRETVPALPSRATSIV